ncbi:MAG TPA: FUSC family protein [Candidatus Saccharimonadia bacterium]|jgi:uncharacterized membrane protein YccC
MSKNQAAATKAIRTAVVAFAGFAIGLWGLQNVNVAIFATFSSFALLGQADFGGSLRARCVAYLAATAAGLIFVALGTLASTTPILVEAIVTFVAAVVIVMLGLLGGYFAAAANAIPLFYLVAVGTPATASMIPSRLVGVVFGGILSAVAAVTLWPRPSQSSVLPVLGQKIQKLNDRLTHLLAGDPSDGTTELHSSEARRFIDSLAARPASPSASDRAAVYLITDIERLGRLLGGLDQAVLSDHEHKMLQAASKQLSSASRLLIGASDSAAVPGSPPDFVVEFTIAARLSVAAQQIIEHASIAIGRNTQASSRLQGIDLDGSARGVWRHGVHRVRSNLSLRSGHFQDGLRLGLALAISIAIARIFHLQHGFWVALATLTVVRSSIVATGQRVVEVIAGTLAGLAFSFFVIAILGSNQLGYAILTPVLIALAIYASSALGFIMGQAAFTATVIVLFNLLAPAGWPVGVARVEDVLAGCVIGLVVGALAWPQGAASALRQTMAELITSGTQYLAGTIEQVFLHQPHSDEVAIKERVMNDAANAEDAFAQYLSEKPSSTEIESWSMLLARANRLWNAADFIGAYSFTSDSDPSEKDLESSLWQLEHSNAKAAQLLKNGGLVRPNRDQFQPPVGDTSIIGWLHQLSTLFKEGT